MEDGEDGKPSNPVTIAAPAMERENLVARLEAFNGKEVSQARNVDKTTYGDLDYTDIPHTQIRKWQITASRLLQSKQTIPHYYISYDTCVDKLMEKRLFSLINDLTTVVKVVTERKTVKDKPNANSGSRSRGSTKVQVDNLSAP